MTSLIARQSTGEDRRDGARPRVAMLVLNPCDNDARVLRSAGSLADAGADVRVYALGNNRFPEGMVSVQGVDVHRLQVRSWLHITLGILRTCYLVLSGSGAPADAVAGRSSGRGRLIRLRWLRYVGAPFLPLVVLLRQVLAPEETAPPAARRRPRLLSRTARALRATARSWRRSLNRSVVRARRRAAVARWRTARAVRRSSRRLARAAREVLPAAVSGPLQSPQMRRRRRASRWQRLLDRTAFRWRRRRFLARRRWIRRMRKVSRWWRSRSRVTRRGRGHVRRLRARSRAAVRRTSRRLRLRRLHRRRRARRRAVLRAAGRRRLRRRVRRHHVLTRAALLRLRRRVLRATYLGMHRGLRRVLLPVHRPTTIRAFWAAASTEMATWRPDVIHAHDLNTLPAARRAADELQVPVVYDSHELWRHRNRHGQLRPLGRLSDALTENRLVRDVDAVITVSPSIARWLERTYQLERPVHVVRNTPLRQLREPRRGVLGRRPGEKVVVYSGRFTSGRGLEDMVRALVHLPQHVVLTAVGYGDEEYVESLESLARSLDVAERVRFVGPVPPADVPSVIADGDLALVAIEPTCLSYRYALPNKLFEAVQAGVPVVASDLPDITEIVTEYGLGRQFPHGDSLALATAVADVLADPSGARTASRRAADELCWENEVHRLLDCYRDMGFFRSAAPVAPRARRPQEAIAQHDDVLAPAVR